MRQLTETTSVFVRQSLSAMVAKRFRCAPQSEDRPEIGLLNREGGGGTGNSTSHFYASPPPARDERGGRVWAIVLWETMRAEDAGDISRPIPISRFDQFFPPQDKSGDKVAQPPIATFYKPVRYEWSEARYEGMVEAKRLSETIHANH